MHAHAVASLPVGRVGERAILFGGLWLAYLLGGLLAGIGLMLWQLNALLVPTLALIALAGLDVFRPSQPSLVPA